MTMQWMTSGIFAIPSCDIWGGKQKIGGDFIINYADIEAVLGVKTAISPLMRGYIEQWETLFSGNSESREQKEGLHLAAAICTEFARLIFAESKIEITGNSKTADYLQSMIDNHLPALQTRPCLKNKTCTKNRKMIK